MTNEYQISNTKHKIDILNSDIMILYFICHFNFVI